MNAPLMFTPFKWKHCCYIVDNLQTVDKPYVYFGRL